MAELSTKPYLIRAIPEWCTDSGYRPHIAVVVDERTVVPREFVRNGEIVLNVSAMATNRLQISNDLIEFEARFGGVARHVSIPIENVSAIYAQETGHGMAFEVPKALALVPEPQRTSDSGGQAGADAMHAADPASQRAREPGAAGDREVPGARRRPKLAAVPSVPPPSSAPPSADTPRSPPTSASEPAKTPKRRRKDAAGERSAARVDERPVEAAPADDADAPKAGADATSPAPAPGTAATGKSRSRGTRSRSSPRNSDAETGMAKSPGDEAPRPAGDDGPSGDDSPPPAPAGRPRLTRIK